jgi:TPR repeat protein
MNERDDDTEARAAWDEYDKRRALYEQLETARRLYEAKNYREALDIYRSLAERETPVQGEIFMHLGRMFERGQGTPADLAQAGQWFERAANTGSAVGTYAVFAIRFREGRYTEAKDWLERAANQGYTPAIYYLGRLYESGKGVGVDRKKAHEYFERAAAQGHLLAKRQIAVSLLKGEHGLIRVPRGLLMCITVFWSLTRTLAADPTSERVQQ